MWIILIIFGLLQIWECALNWCTLKPIHKHILDICLLVLVILDRHVLVGVNPCGRCVIVVPLPQIPKLLKKSQNIDFKICEFFKSLKSSELSEGLIIVPTPI